MPFHWVNSLGFTPAGVQEDDVAQGAGGSGEQGGHLHLSLSGKGINRQEVGGVLVPTWRNPRSKTELGAGHHRVEPFAALPVGSALYGRAEACCRLIFHSNLPKIHAVSPPQQASLDAHINRSPTLPADSAVVAGFGSEHGGPNDAGGGGREDPFLAGVDLAASIVAALQQLQSQPELAAFLAAALELLTDRRRQQVLATLAAP